MVSIVSILPKTSLILHTKFTTNLVVILTILLETASIFHDTNSRQIHKPIPGIRVMLSHKNVPPTFLSLELVQLLHFYISAWPQPTTPQPFWPSWAGCSSGGSCISPRIRRSIVVPGPSHGWNIPSSVKIGQINIVCPSVPCGGGLLQEMSLGQWVRPGLCCVYSPGKAFSSKWWYVLHCSLVHYRGKCLASKRRRRRRRREPFFVMHSLWNWTPSYSVLGGTIGRIERSFLLMIRFMAVRPHYFRWLYMYIFHN